MYFLTFPPLIFPNFTIKSTKCAVDVWYALTSSSRHTVYVEKVSHFVMHHLFCFHYSFFWTFSHTFHFATFAEDHIRPTSCCLTTTLIEYSTWWYDSMTVTWYIWNRAFPFCFWQGAINSYKQEENCSSPPNHFCYSYVFEDISYT